MLEMDQESIICVDLNDDWCVKIVDNYGNVDFLIIRDNIKNISEITDISDIFDNIILPKQKIDQYGHVIFWSVFDRENLYTINELPSNDWNRTQNPMCFESESEYYNEQTVDLSNQSYFDRITQNF